MHDTGMIGDVLEAYERLILDAMRATIPCLRPPRVSSGCGRCRYPCSKHHRRCAFIPGASSQDVDASVATQALRLPFERAWRNPNPEGG